MANDTTVDLHYKGTKYQLDYTKLTVKECMELQLLTGYTPAMLIHDFARGGIFGVVGFLYAALKKSGVDVKWEDLVDDEAFGIAGDLNTEEPQPVDPSEAPSPAPPPRKTTRKPSVKK